VAADAADLVEKSEAEGWKLRRASKLSRSLIGGSRVHFRLAAQLGAGPHGSLVRAGPRGASGDRAGDRFDTSSSPRPRRGPVTRRGAASPRAEQAAQRPWRGTGPWEPPSLRSGPPPSPIPAIWRGRLSR